MFQRFFKLRPQKFRGHNFGVDSRTMTIPDAVPTLKEIILSGSVQRVGTPEYDETFEEGAMRWRIQNTPLDVVLNEVDSAFNDEERSDKEVEKDTTKDKATSPAEPAKPEAE